MEKNKDQENLPDNAIQQLSACKDPTTHKKTKMKMEKLKHLYFISKIETK